MTPSSACAGTARRGGKLLCRRRLAPPHDSPVPDSGSASVAMRPPAPSLSRRRRLLIPVVAIILALLLLLGIFTGIYTDLLWFREVGYSKVFTKILQTRLMLFALF